MKNNKMQMSKTFVTVALIVGQTVILGACSDSPSAPKPVPSAPANPLTAPAQVSVTPNLTPAAPATVPAPNPTLPTAPASPKQFVVSDLKIGLSGVRLSEMNTVTAKVTNVGMTTATYTAVIQVKPAWNFAPVKILPQPSQDVTLGPGESTIVTFQVGVGGNGAVIVTIEDLGDRFIVDSQI